MKPNTHGTYSELDMMMLREGFIRFGAAPSTLIAKRKQMAAKNPAKGVFWFR